MPEPAPQPDEIVKLWLTNFREYAKAHLRIQTMEGEIVPFNLNPIQDVFLDIVEDIEKNNRLKRIVVLKARREGISTLTAGRFYWKTSTRPNRYAMMIAHEPDASTFIFGMHKRFYSHSEFKPQTRYSNMRLLEFNRPDGKPGGLDSAIRVATAGKEDVGSSQMITYLHCSEVSKWPSHTTEQLFTSVMQCVPSTPDSEVIIESTAKGVGGKFYSMYWGSRFKYNVFLNPDGTIGWKCEIDEKAPESDTYSAIFFPWFIFPQYSQPVAQWERTAGKKFERTEEEQQIVDLHFKGVDENVTNRKLCWRRWAIVNLCGNSTDHFNQEYPATAMEAFLGTGSPVFDAMQVQNLMKNAPEPIARYDVLPATGMVVYRKDGPLWVWKEPDPLRRYIVGADVAEGIEVAKEGDKSLYDFSAASVIDHVTGEQVAEYHGHIDPDLFGKVLATIGKRYGEAIVAPERNNHGHTVITRLMNDGYRNLFVERIPDPPNKPRKRYGWLTTMSSKPEMIDGLIADMRENTHGIKSTRVFEEMLSYKRDEKGRYGAEIGRHDDALTAIGIAKRVRILTPLRGNRRPGDTQQNRPTPVFAHSNAFS